MFTARLEGQLALRAGVGRVFLHHLGGLSSCNTHSIKLRRRWKPGDLDLSAQGHGLGKMKECEYSTPGSDLRMRRISEVISGEQLNNHTEVTKK